MQSSISLPTHISWHLSFALLEKKNLYLMLDKIREFSPRVWANVPHTNNFVYIPSLLSMIRKTYRWKVETANSTKLRTWKHHCWHLRNVYIYGSICLHLVLAPYRYMGQSLDRDGYFQRWKQWTKNQNLSVVDCFICQNQKWKVDKWVQKIPLYCLSWNISCQFIMKYLTSV